LANNATVAVSAARAITVTAGGFGANHVIVDLLGRLRLNCRRPTERAGEQGVWRQAAD